MGGCFACFRSQQEEVVKLPEDQEKKQTETAPPALSHPSPVEPLEDTGATVLDACPGPSTSRGALQEVGASQTLGPTITFCFSSLADLPQGHDPEASSLQPPRPIFVWSSSSASTEYLHLSATCSFSPSCLSLNPSASPPRGIHDVEENLANLMALQNKQVEDRQEDLMIFSANLQHVVMMRRQLQQLSTRLGQLEAMLVEN
ncbi:uncharacterized protein LOC128337256 [Hemicordylus capensis]|uniref:uncharacterized protein LOC128337256 n=1 Tax=Hemicordylus capensis TaxID=884348 RepID=UPI002302475A|nr:uncharacterized protein LOC128337256 [Hemicordylus capensis]